MIMIPLSEIGAHADARSIVILFHGALLIAQRIGPVTVVGSALACDTVFRWLDVPQECVLAGLVVRQRRLTR